LREDRRAFIEIFERLLESRQACGFAIGAVLAFGLALARKKGRRFLPA